MHQVWLVFESCWLNNTFSGSHLPINYRVGGRVGGTLVSYGGMSMKPVTIPTSMFIFKGIQARGFWLSGDDAKPGARALKAAAVDKVPPCPVSRTWRVSAVSPVKKPS